MEDKITDKWWIVVCDNKKNSDILEVTPIVSLTGDIAEKKMFPDYGKIFWKFNTNKEIKTYDIWKVGVRVSDNYFSGRKLCKYEVDWNKNEPVEFELIDLTKYNLTESEIIKENTYLTIDYSLTEKIFFKDKKYVIGPFEWEKIEENKYRFFIPDFKKFIYYLYEWSEFKDFILEANYQLFNKSVKRNFIKDDQIPKSIKSSKRDSRNPNKLIKWYLNSVSNLEEISDDIQELLTRSKIKKIADSIKSLKPGNEKLQEHRLKRLRKLSNDFEIILKSSPELLDPLFNRSPYSEILEKRIFFQIQKRKNEIEAAIKKQKEKLDNLKERKKDMENKINKLKENYENKLNTLQEVKEHLISEKDRLIKDMLIQKKIINEDNQDLNEGKKKIKTSYEETSAVKRKGEMYTSESHFLKILEENVYKELPVLKWESLYDFHSLLKSNKMFFMKGFRKEYCQQIVNIYAKISQAELKIISVEKGWVGKQSLFGQVDNFSRSFIPSEHGFFDFFCKAILNARKNTENLFIILLLNSNYSLESSYLQNLIEMSCNDLSLDIFSPKAVSSEDPYYNFNRIKWPGNLRIICCRDINYHRNEIFWDSLLPLLRIEKNSDEQNQVNLTNLNKTLDFNSNKYLSFKKMNRWKTDFEVISKNELVKDIFNYLQKINELNFSNNEFK
ncbi:MAG: hypothetical protein ACOCP8_03530 [archaeon]